MARVAKIHRKIKGVNVDEVEQSIVNHYCQGLMLKPYSQEFGRLLSDVRNETGIELSFRQLWLRLLSLKERCEIYDEESPN